MIHKLEGGFAISSKQVWRPGSYDTARAARYAFRFDDAQLQMIQESKAGARITFEDLQAARRAKVA